MHNPPGEEYAEEGFTKRLRLGIRALKSIPLDEMAKILFGAGYLVQAGLTKTKSSHGNS